MASFPDRGEAGAHEHHEQGHAATQVAEAMYAAALMSTPYDKPASVTKPKAEEKDRKAVVKAN